MSDRFQEIKVDREELDRVIRDAMATCADKQKCLAYMRSALSDRYDVDEMLRIAELRSTPKGRAELLQSETKIDTRFVR
jgi:hypothetical protein